MFLHPRALVRPIQAFVSIEASSGIVLLAAAVAAVVWINSPASASYHDVWEWSHRFAIPGGHVEPNVHALINDGLMALFFYVAGLEIKRELREGELNSVRRAALPAIAAAGGMAVPALIYVAFTASSGKAQGWGIPMATDIAFALGVLTLVGQRVPLTLKVFLLALAIVDDLGAILVIALFYSGSIHIGALLISVACLVAVFGAVKVGLRWLPLYLVLGVCAWLAMLESGVHATIAGVLLAFLTAVDAREDRDSALDRAERLLHPWVSYAVVPLFAVANAGVTVSGASLHAAITSDVALGVGIGLLVGKPAGILSAAWLAVRLRLADLPEGLTWRHLGGAGLLGGIGFTVSLFVTELAFSDANTVGDVKIAIFAASMVAGALGLASLWGVAPARGELADQTGQQPASPESVS